jgi:hypothetical protein
MVGAHHTGVARVASSSSSAAVCHGGGGVSSVWCDSCQPALGQRGTPVQQQQQAEHELVTAKKEWCAPEGLQHDKDIRTQNVLVANRQKNRFVS